MLLSGNKEGISGLLVKTQKLPFWLQKKALDACIQSLFYKKCANCLEIRAVNTSFLIATNLVDQGKFKTTITISRWSKLRNV